MSIRFLSALSKRNKRIIEILGWFGMVMILLAYGLNASGALSSQSEIYLLMNLTSLFVGLNALVQKARPAAVLEFIWAAITMVHLISLCI